MLTTPNSAPVGSPAALPQRQRVEGAIQVGRSVDQYELGHARILRGGALAQ